MAKPTASKTKPEVVHTVTINEIHLVPGRLDDEGNPDCKVTINANSSDPEQRVINELVDMQAYVDTLSATDVAKINAFLAQAFGDGIGVDPGTISGDFISQTP